MPLLDFRKPKCVVHKEVQSYTGKYTLFYGHHYVKGKICYDVGAINRETGEITTRHYIDEGRGDPKAEALRIFDRFAKGLTTKPAHEEQLDNDPRIADAFRRAVISGRNDA
jgi:hypothetical protein